LQELSLGAGRDKHLYHREEASQEHTLEMQQHFFFFAKQQYEEAWYGQGLETCHHHGVAQHR